MKLGHFQESREGNLVPLLDELDRRRQRERRDNLKCLAFLGALYFTAQIIFFIWGGS